MKVVVLASLAAPSIDGHDALIEDALSAAGPAIGRAPAPAFAAAPGSPLGLPKAGAGTIRGAAPR